jgi:hypothetical protein
MKKDSINQIIEIEWNMFENVSNIGDKASCQKDPETFKIMRSSQFSSWSDDVLKSYLNDLISAREKGRNLMTEKYARMMEFTSPEEYKNIAQFLPAINKKNLELINEIVRDILEWENELSRKFPYIKSRGRPAHSSGDSQYTTSIETYLRGELATYSFNTLILYRNDIKQNKLDNINASAISLLNMVKSYGWKSLEEANESLKNH